MFHVPEHRRLSPKDHPLLGTTFRDGNNGAFHVDSPEPGWTLFLICSDGRDPDAPEGDGWEHVSVHADNNSRKRTPNWREMCFVKRMCWDDEDVVVQFHPRESEYVNCHPHVLHLWRHSSREFPTPPAILVGPVPQKEVTA